MNLLDTLTRAADEEQLRLHPLPEHAAAGQEEHLRRHYALLLAAVLTSQASISEPQTRLLRLLLDALKLGDIRGPLFEQARDLTPETLLEATRLIREVGFAEHLVLDTLVLLRLDAPLNDEAARLVGELAVFLGLDESGLTTRVQDASDILGLGADASGSNHVAAAKGGDGGNDGDDVEFTWSLAELWPAHLRQPLTAEALRVGLQGGVWLLDADLAVDFPWQANDAILCFKNGAMFNTVATEGAIKLTGCRLFDATTTFTGNSSITLERCEWRGNYDPVAQRTVLKLAGGTLTVIDSQFATRNARAIWVQGGGLTLSGSRFTHCGHEELSGGAILHSQDTRTITNCHFDRCLAARGGAIYVPNLVGVSRCEFVACESRALQSQQAADVAIFAESNSANPVLTQCVFRRTSVNVGDSFAGRGREIAVDCQFVQGNLFFRENDGHIFDRRSTFDGGSVVQRDFRP